MITHSNLSLGRCDLDVVNSQKVGQKTGLDVKDFFLEFLGGYSGSLVKNWAGT